VREWLIRHEGRVAFALAATYFLVYATLSVLRHLSYHSLGFDLGLYDQVFWNTSQGRILESTMSQGMPIPHSQMSDHFSPIYLALEPFYLAFPHPETLVVLQTLALTLGAWPIFLLARLKLSEGYALLWVAVYFLSVPLAYINPSTSTRSCSQCHRWVSPSTSWNEDGAAGFCSRCW
jgi:uncharacterized membrane protein